MQPGLTQKNVSVLAPDEFKYWKNLLEYIITIHSTAWFHLTREQWLVGHRNLRENRAKNKFMKRLPADFKRTKISTIMKPTGYRNETVPKY